MSIYDLRDGVPLKDLDLVRFKGAVLSGGERTRTGSSCCGTCSDGGGGGACSGCGGMKDVFGTAVDCGGGEDVTFLGLWPLKPTNFLLTPVFFVGFSGIFCNPNSRSFNLPSSSSLAASLIVSVGAVFDCFALPPVPADAASRFIPSRGEWALPCASGDGAPVDAPELLLF